VCSSDLEDSEPIGLWPNTDSPKTIDVADGANLMGKNFVVAPQVNLSGEEARVIGTACTADSACGANGICGTGFPGGYCTKDCAKSACPAGSKCLSGEALSICLDTCTGPRAGQSTCRANYVCDDDGSGTGVCIPNCNSIMDFCDATQTCGTNGYCQ
jgi:serine protease